jgi:hypothetical protein
VRREIPLRLLDCFVDLHHDSLKLLLLHQLFLISSLLPVAVSPAIRSLPTTFVLAPTSDPAWLVSRHDIIPRLPLWSARPFRVLLPLPLLAIRRDPSLLPTSAFEPVRRPDGEHQLDKLRLDPRQHNSLLDVACDSRVYRAWPRRVGRTGLELDEKGEGKGMRGVGGKEEGNGREQLTSPDEERR